SSNDAPTAVNDTYAATENTTLNVSSATSGVLQNDSDSGDSAVISGAVALLAAGETAVLDSNASHGTVALNPDGTFTYNPNPDFFGQDTFTYHINDPGASNVNPAELSNIATVTINVASSNDAPTAVNDTYAATENTTLNVSSATSGVLQNDSDSGDSAVISGAVALLAAGETAVLDSNASHGTVALNPDGTFTYNPNPDFFGQDTFTYHINDPGASNVNPAELSNIATVTINVASSNDAPTAVNDTYAATENTTLNVSSATSGVLQNDSDSGDSSVISGAVALLAAGETAVLDTNASHGNVVLNPDGTFTYNPNPDFFGQDTFTYHINDPVASNVNPAEHSNTLQVTLTISSSNDAPTAVNDTYAATENTTLN